MHCSQSCLQSLDLICVLRVFGLLILAILFLQSGVDKITDWKGNLGWLKGHFANSPFRNVVPLVLGILTVQEMLAVCSVWAGWSSICLPPNLYGGIGCCHRPFGFRGSLSRRAPRQGLRRCRRFCSLHDF